MYINRMYNCRINKEEDFDLEWNGEKMKYRFPNCKIEKVLTSILLKTNTAVKISKKINSTQSSVIEILRILESYNLITKEKIGRVKIITLTEKGKRAQELLIELKGLML